MGEYLTLLTQVKDYIYNAKTDLARETLKRLLNRLNLDYGVAVNAEKEKVRKALAKLLPVFEDLKRGEITERVISVLSLDRARIAAGAAIKSPSPKAVSGATASHADSDFKKTGKHNNNILMPLTLDDYIGQENAKRSLRISINASKKSGRPLSHLLICSSYGLGKTTLANIIANEMGMPFFNVNATNLKDATSLSLYFSKIDKSCIVFIDEIHRLKKDVQTVLLSIMTDFTVNLLDESGEQHCFNLPPFTVIGATTQAGELLKPFINRFAVLELEDYTESEKKILVESKFKKLGVSATEDAIYEISRRCRGIPRTIETYVKGVIDVALAQDQQLVTKELTDVYFDINQIDGNGLTKNDLKLLQALDEAHRPLALITLESKLNIQKEDIEFRYEPYLYKLGFIDKTMQGRVITEKGRNYLHSDNSGDGNGFEKPEEPTEYDSSIESDKENTSDNDELLPFSDNDESKND